MAKGEYKLSVNDFVVKAAAVALKAVPEVNSEWRDSHIRRYHNVDINVAVNTDKGLLTPIVRDCDKIGLATISNTVKAVAGRAQEGSSTLDDLQV
jgi:pyruvate dehydrogenase E2 component (dihydrolipoamide acetyltransferase)